MERTTFLVRARNTNPPAAATAVSSHSITAETPSTTAAPFPPLKPRKGEKLWPIVATPAARKTTVSGTLRKIPTYTARAPLAASKIRTARPHACPPFDRCSAHPGCGYRPPGCRYSRAAVRPGTRLGRPRAGRRRRVLQSSRASLVNGTGRSDRGARTGGVSCRVRAHGRAPLRGHRRVARESYSIVMARRHRLSRSAGIRSPCRLTTWVPSIIVEIPMYVPIMAAG